MDGPGPDLDAALPAAAPGLDAEDLDGDEGAVADGVVEARLVAPEGGDSIDISWMPLNLSIIKFGVLH